LKKLYKKRIIITGGSGLLGGYFYEKYKNIYSITKYPYRIEKFKKFESWLRYSFCRPLIVMFALDVSSIKLFPKLEVASARVESWMEERYPYFGLNRIK